MISVTSRLKPGRCQYKHSVLTYSVHKDRGELKDPRQSWKTPWQTYNLSLLWFFCFLRTKKICINLPLCELSLSGLHWAKVHKNIPNRNNKSIFRQKISQVFVNEYLSILSDMCYVWYICLLQPYIDNMQQHMFILMYWSGANITMWQIWFPYDMSSVIAIKVVIYVMNHAKKSKWSQYIFSSVSTCSTTALLTRWPGEILGVQKIKKSTSNIKVKIKSLRGALNTYISKDAFYLRGHN